MRRYVGASLFLTALVCAVSVFGFSPPVDRQGGVALSIGDFPEKKSDGAWSGRKVPTDQPLAFTVTLTNGSAETVSGTVSLWLNGDWEVSGTNRVFLEARPGASAAVTCAAVAKPSVLNALYPVHARLALELDGKRVELHPVAIFEAIKLAAAVPAATFAETVLADGVLRLDSGAACRVSVCQNGKTVDLGVGFNGMDKASGMHMRHDTSVCGGIPRVGFSVHPPYFGKPGVTWNDFKVSLPAGKPAVLTFFTALRTPLSNKPSSDGTEFKVFVIGEDKAEKELFTRFSDSRAWEPARVDLGAYAGQSVTVRLWTGPGPQNNTTCDLCAWGDPVIAVGRLPVLPTEEQWQAREKEAVAQARLALAEKPRRGSGTFRLRGRDGQLFGAAAVLGEQGLTDGVLAFSDGSRELTYRGFVCDIDQSAISGVEDGQPVLRVETATEGGAWAVTHHVAPASGTGALLPMRAKLWADGGALRITWDMPGVTRDTRGTPRYTRLGIGAGKEAVWRAYMGFGNVVENPGAFILQAGGFRLSTRHVGADYTNGLSLVQACDVFPDRLTHVPATRRFALETHHDAAFFFVPSASGAFAAAREYRELCGFTKGRGVNALLGRVCLDQWSGDYLAAAKDLNEAARYGVTDAVFVKHSWQRWGYDYRLPEIYPPKGGLEPFLAMRMAAEKAGMLFCPHDNYIDFYPDAEGFSYDHMVFTADGLPKKAWFNPGPNAQSYRWRPDAFMPWLTANMKLMRTGFHPDGLFIDVFTAAAPFDYFDRAGIFYPGTRTAKEWRDAFDTCRKILKRGGPMLSEAGHDALIGSVDGGQSDHFAASLWFKEFSDADRTPWHDMATHGKMVLFAGGLGLRYALEWDDPDDKLSHGYGSDDYFSATVMGGRNPMCDGPFSRRAVMTYWLLHDVCAVLARETFETHAFGATVKQQHTAFSGGCRVWVNRGSNAVWTVADGKKLPEYGFYVSTPDAEAGVMLIGNRRAGFAKSRKSFFADARPTHNPLQVMSAASSVSQGKYLGNGTFDVTFDWNVLRPPLTGYVPFLHVCPVLSSPDSKDPIAIHPHMAFDRNNLERAGRFTASSHIVFPPNVPAGTYNIRYGLYRQDTGERLPIQGLTDNRQRVCGGVLTVEKSGGLFTKGTFTPESDDVRGRVLGLNVDGEMLDFGPLVTDGAFRLLHGGRRAWRLIPLPGSHAFRAEIRLAELGAARAEVKTVETDGPFTAAAKAPEWSQDGATLRLACDGLSFAYRIVFR
ncbi:MAG: hypothetical protein PHV28_05600 [Kiritimatiellae bacterium]|nr:hypothetical protein [Kiritimatiellia bacterium]